MAKTGVIISLDGDESVKQIITSTVRALRQANKPKVAETFQVELVSGKKKLMEVVKEYVVVT